MTPTRLASLTVMAALALTLAGCPMGRERPDRRDRGQDSSRDQHDDGRGNTDGTHRPDDPNHRPPSDDQHPR